MTEDVLDNAGRQEEARPSTGRMLAEARERLGLSVAEAAQQIRLSPRQVEALETDDHASLPGKTFLRGFIRNYARLLQIDPEPLLAACRVDQPQAQAIEVPSRRIEFGGRRGLLPFPGRFRVSQLKFAAAIVVAVALLSWGGYELSQWQPSPREAPAKSGGETTMALSLPPLVVPVAPVPAVVPVPPAATPDPVAPAAAETGGPLDFAFDGDAWVEVKDKSGKVIFYQLNPKGSQQSVRGTPPFFLVVGNAAHVRLSYAGKPVDLAPYIKVNVARLTLE